MKNIAHNRERLSSYKSSCLGVGGAFIDAIYRVDDAFLKNEGIKKGSRIDISNLSAEDNKNILHSLNHNFSQQNSNLSLETFCTGGSAANTIYNMHVLGEHTSFVGTVAKDRFGDYFVDVFFTNGSIPAYWEGDKPVCFKQIDLQGNSARSTSVCIIYLTPDGERTMLVNNAASKLIEVADVKKPIEQTAGIFTESYELVYCEDKDLLGYILQKAEELNLYTAIGLSDVELVKQNRDFINRHLQRKAVKFVFGTEDEFIALIDAKDDAALLDYMTKRCAEEHKTMVITRAEEGAWVIDDQGKKYNIEAVPVDDKVVDTTGAGDGFAAGYLFGYVRNSSSPELCGKLGALVASNIVQCLGSNLMTMSDEGIETLLKKVDNLLKNH